ncbi:proline-specific peptidase [Crucibulum laeve]|uniref:Proline-specific peptidase n=1 Tax=Crucibulum laeve TaxID=68775 RepID=A0A5C3M5T5_9AGAR|nr:proline-specific peptidase [Crucibulum laeve]
MAETTGKIDFRVGEETYQTWYKLIGNLNTGKRPLIILHGGPGVDHNMILPHIDLFEAHGIPVIFYDQIGIGNSTHLQDKPKAFWTVELFMDELDNVLSHFGIADDFDLLGHSWGGMLGAQYVAERQPQGLKRLILANAPASMPLWEKGTSILLDQLPVEQSEIIMKHEKAQTTDAKEYRDIMNIFYHTHVCRLNPWPQDLLNSFRSTPADPTVYRTMLGPSEFTINGVLKDWSVVDMIHTIKVPTLLINSAYDEAHDVCIEPFFKRLPKVKWVQFANSSHTPFLEEREGYMKVVGEFLTTV